VGGYFCSLFFTFCYFLLFFLLLVTFVNYFLLSKGAKGVVLACFFFLFKGERVRHDFNFFFFFIVEGEGGGS